MQESPSISELAQLVNANVQGNGSVRVSRVASIEDATEGTIAFLADKKYLPKLQSCAASAIILPESLASRYQGNAIISKNPKWAYAVIAKKLHPIPCPKAGIHPSSVVHPSAKIGKGVHIGAFVAIEAHAKVGDGCVIEAGCVIGEGVELGANTRLYPSVTLYHDVAIGQHCTIQSGAVIGGEGFGFARSHHGWEKVPQLGTVIIGNNVEIGANTTIDRGAMGDTIISNHVILDNLIQIAHNVHIGQCTAIAANTGIAGSTKIGENCLIGGGCNINGHITICDNVQLVGGSGVAQPIKEPGAYGSSTTVSEVKTWMKNAIRFNQLDKMAVTLTKLEKRFEALEEQKSG